MEPANAQTRIIERDIARLAEDHTKLNLRFDRHLEIYAANGKELAALKTKVDTLDKSIHEKCDEILMMIRENRKIYATKDELAAVADTMTPVKSIVYGLVGLIMTAVVVALLALVVRQWNFLP